MEVGLSEYEIKRTKLLILTNPIQQAKINQAKQRIANTLGRPDLFKEK
jgi:hypothetical protein